MTLSKEYKNADWFKRKIMSEIKWGKHLIKRGWIGKLPADVDTLEMVKRVYEKFLLKKKVRS